MFLPTQNNIVADAENDISILIAVNEHSGYRIACLNGVQMSVRKV
jgi:hypothetical protein